MNKERKDQSLQDEEMFDIDNLTNEQENTEEEINASDNVAEESWEQKYNDLNDSYLRLNAEFDNFRKRTSKEKAELLKMGSERVLLDIISIVDDFERAIETISKTDASEAVIEGIELIYNKFKNFLTKHGVTEVATIGEQFDVDKHEAVTMIPATKEEDKNKIIDCIQKGYMLGDKVIRFPKVIVAK